jgi:hypothetical protein
VISVSPVHHFAIAATVIDAAKPPEGKCLVGATSSAPMRQFNVSYSVILEIVMLRQLIIAIAAASALGISFCPTDASRAAEADSVPSWDLTASCRAAASAGYSETPSERVKSCLASEQRTREEITKNWSTFPAADRIGCVKSLTFSPTYTELLTCLEMRRDVKKLRDAKPADTNPRR